MNFKNRENTFLAILAYYLLPLSILFFYNLKIADNGAWTTLLISLLLTSLGSLFLFLQLDRTPPELIDPELSLHQGKMQVPALEEEKSSFHPAIEQIKLLQNNLEQSQQHIQTLESELLEKEQTLLKLSINKENAQHQINKLQNDLQNVKESFEEKLEQNQIFLREHQQTISEQRHALETKQQHIQQLEDKVRDLTYEIKTLLNLAEKSAHSLSEAISSHDSSSYGSEKEVTSYLPNDPHENVQNEESAIRQLKQCIEIAEKMIGASHYSRHPRMQNLSINHEALDLRRLFESLRNEENCPMMIFSQKENKPIFANHQMRALLGWTNDKFFQNFASLIEFGADAWQNGLTQLSYKNECLLDLSLKAKDGSLISTKCHLGLISTGLFRGHIFGVLYQEIEPSAMRISHQ